MSCSQLLIVELPTRRGLVFRLRVLQKSQTHFLGHRRVESRMAESERQSDLNEVLKPFHQRASEAEDRLSRLESSLARKNDAGNEELLKMVSELQSKLETAKSDQASEREKAQKEIQKWEAENAKLKYRINHLVQAVKEADCKLESK